MQVSWNFVQLPYMVMIPWRVPTSDQEQSDMGLKIKDAIIVWM